MESLVSRLATFHFAELALSFFIIAHHFLFEKLEEVGGLGEVLFVRPPGLENDGGNETQVVEFAEAVPTDALSYGVFFFAITPSRALAIS